MRRILVGLVAIAWVAGIAETVEARSPGERYDAQIRLSTQGTVHHDDFNQGEVVQHRNEVRLEFRYTLLGPGESLGIIKSAKFSLLWRGRYDSIFDLRDHYKDLGYDRDDFRFPEGKTPRELFFDFEFSGALSGLSARIGRQQVVWGEADLFRSLDVVNPLSINQNGLVGEDFADYREPLWIAKFLYDLKSVGPVANAGLEFFVSPNGLPTVHPANVIYGEFARIGVDENNILTGLTRPGATPFDRVRHPWEVGRVGGLRTDSPDQAINPDGSKADFIYLIRSDVPRTEFHVDRMMGGFRFMGSMSGVDFTLNYIFKRTDAAGTAVEVADLFDPSLPDTGAPQPALLGEAVAAAGTPDLNGNGLPDGMEAQIRRCIFDKEPQLILTSVRGTGNATTGCVGVPLWSPWTHIAGFTMTYNDYNTGLIWRTEQSFSTKEPRNGVYALTSGRPVPPGARDFATEGRRTTQVWRSMVGFDYLSSIAPQAARNQPDLIRSLLSDQWFLTFQFLNEYYAHADNQTALITSSTDRMQHWNPVFTAAATGFFLGGRFRPLISAGYDVNAEFPVFIIQGDLHLTDRISLRIAEINYAGSKNDESFLFLHKYADRDTFLVRLTYYLL